jgi:hypothetical protein
MCNYNWKNFSIREREDRFRSRSAITAKFLVYPSPFVEAKNSIF